MEYLIYIKQSQKLDKTMRIGNKKVTQPWQRDRAMLASFLINTQRYSQNHKIAFVSHPGIRSNISTLCESFNTKKLCSKVLSKECHLNLFVKQRSSISKPPFGDLGVTYATIHV